MCGEPRVGRKNARREAKTKGSDRASISPPRAGAAAQRPGATRPAQREHHAAARAAARGAGAGVCAAVKRRRPRARPSAARTPSRRLARRLPPPFSRCTDHPNKGCRLPGAGKARRPRSRCVRASAAQVRSRFPSHAKNARSPIALSLPHHSPRHSSAARAARDAMAGSVCVDGNGMNCRGQTRTDRKKKKNAVCPETRHSRNNFSHLCSHRAHNTRLPIQHMARPALLAAVVVLAVAAGSGEWEREAAFGRPAAITRRDFPPRWQGGCVCVITTARPPPPPPTLSLSHCAGRAIDGGRSESRVCGCRVPLTKTLTHTFPSLFTPRSRHRRRRRGRQVSCLQHRVS